MGFPDPHQADADGLLAYGGDLHPERLLAAYAQGIFPWPGGEDWPTLWYSPDPRMVLVPEALHIGRSFGIKEVVLMNDQVDNKNRFIKKLFWMITKNVKKGETMGKLIGSIMMPLEKLLISLKNESPATEIKLYQKIDAECTF